MELIETALEDEDEDPLGRQMGPCAVLWSRVKLWWIINIWRRVPRLVWYGDEVDVRVTFKDIGALGGDRGQVFKAARLFRDMGICFDTGSGCHGSDWEWDFSLRGPVSLKFRGRAKRPERRVAQDEPELKVAS